MPGLHKIAIAGATGALGVVLTDELVKAGFKVTAFTRDASTAKLPDSVTAVTVDYNSLESVTKALQGQDALISALGTQGLPQQKLLVDASIAAGVQRIIPSEFGSDHVTDEVRSLPVFADKIELKGYIKEKTAGTSTTYTFVYNNAFLDWGLEQNFIINVKEGKVNQFDGGDVPFTATPLYLIGQGVAGILKNPDETANRGVRIQGRTTTINQLVDTIKESQDISGWVIAPYDTAEHSKQAYVTLKQNPQDVMAWVLPMIFRAAFAKGASVDYSESNDNAVLGIKELTEEEFKEIVKNSVAAVRSG